MSLLITFAYSTSEDSILDCSSPEAVRLHDLHVFFIFFVKVKPIRINNQAFLMVVSMIRWTTFNFMVL